jgi:hypothetical protein
MRTIETAETRKRKKKRNTMIMSIFMLVILLMGTVGFAFSFNSGDTGAIGPADGGNTGPYSDRWSYPYGDQILYFRNGPEEVADSEVNIELRINDYSGKDLYIVSSGDSRFEEEIALNLQDFVPRLQRACFGECVEDLPEKDCSDNLIIFEESTNNVAFQDGNCIFIEGDLKTVDAFLYKIFGVI